MSLEQEIILRDELKIYRFIALYFAIIGVISLASLYLFTRPFSGLLWTAFSIIFGGLCFLSSYAFSTYKLLAIWVVLITMAFNLAGNFLINPTASTTLLYMPTIVIALGIYTHVKHKRIIGITSG